MVRFGLAVVLYAAATAVQGSKLKGPAIVPGAYIVEYEDGHDGSAAINSVASDASKRMDLNYKLFKGVSIQFKDTDTAEDKAAELANRGEIKNVWPVKLYSIPTHTVHSVGDAAVAGLSKRQATGLGNDTFTPHLMTQVDQLRAKGITGKGVKIAVIDTGTDYLNPALGGCFGPGCLVSFGADLVGDAFNGKNARNPGPDPLDQCQGHGSHVAGIIAARSNNPYGIIGAAQGVTLGSFRVFGCTGDTPNDVLISAYNMAYEAGADIITASIGGPSGWSEDDWAVTVQRIVEAGVPCTVSAGNDGSEGQFYASTAANGKRVTAIASVDNTVAPALLINATYTVDGGGNQSFGYTPGTPAKWGGVTLPLWAVNFNTTDTANGCDPYPASTPDLSGYIVLIRRGTCTFVQKATNAVNKGAKYVIVYNNVAGNGAIDVSEVTGIQAIAMVTAETGVEWIRELAAGAKVTVSMTDPDTAPRFLVNFPNPLTPGFLSTYTSWGPTFEVDVKPQLASPGGMILSTYPRALGSYAVLSGTSMACPLSAAIYALIMEVRGTKDPATIENLLSATANPNLFNDGQRTAPYLAPVPQQGAGLIQAYDAAYSTTLLTVSSLSFNDTDHFEGVKNFSISNTGSSAVTYTLSNVGALTAYTFANDSTIEPDTFPNELVPSFAALSFAPSSFSLPAGQRKIVTVTATPPAGLDAKRLPVYSGYIAINGSDSSSLSLPYMGVYGSMHGADVLDAAGTFLSRTLDPNDTAVTDANHTFVLPPRGHANDTAYANKTDLPALVLELAMGSALVRVDVVPVETCRPVNSTAVVLGTQTVGQIDGSPLLYQPRGKAKIDWDGKLADGSYAPAGVYKFAVKALRIFGDPKLASEYDATETISFRIRYQKLGKRKA